MLRRVGVTALGDVVDDSRNVTVLASPYPFMVITGVTAPGSARPGETISVNFSFRNNGGDGIGWLRLYDLDTLEEYVPRTEHPVASGDTGETGPINIMMPNRNLNMRFELGHVEL